MVKFCNCFVDYSFSRFDTGQRICALCIEVTKQHFIDVLLNPRQRKVWILAACCDILGISMIYIIFILGHTVLFQSRVKRSLRRYISYKISTDLQSCTARFLQPGAGMDTNAVSALFEYIPDTMKSQGEKNDLLLRFLLRLLEFGSAQTWHFTTCSPLFQPKPQVLMIRVHAFGEGP